MNLGNIFFLILGIVFLVLTILMCIQESKKRKIHFLVALLICIVLSPLLGYFIISSFALRETRGCKWCGNTDNEAEFCGLCGKNEDGKNREDLGIQIS